MNYTETLYHQMSEDLVLESGKTLHAPIIIAYETYGNLNSKKDNAVLICHALTGSAHAASYHKDETKPGFWDILIGPNKAFDTNKYFIICSNVIGSCYGSTGPSSIDPSTNKTYALNFPFVTVKDMVAAQKRLIDYLGIERLLCVAGGSMGGMQTLQWCKDYPDSLKSAIAIATTYRHNAMQIAFNEVARQAIMRDPAWHQGNYYNSNDFPRYGLSVARMVGHITYLSKASMEKKFGRKLTEKETYNYNFSTDFQVESYLQYKGDGFSQRFDANSFLYLTKAIDYFDLQDGYESLEDALLKATNIKFLIISFSSDWLYPEDQSKHIVNALEANGALVSYRNIEFDYGHDSFLIENREQNYLISNFLKFV